MTFRIPLLDEKNVVVNVTTMEAGAVWKPPAGLTAAPHSEAAEVGDILNEDGTYSKPAPKERATFLARDLVSLWTPDDVSKIESARAADSRIGLWVYMLSSRGEKPVDMTSQTFAQAWGALVAVLGKDRADELLTKLKGL